MKTIFFIVFSLLALFADSQIIINNTVNAVDGLQNVVLGTGLSVSNISSSGTNEQFGSFTCAGNCNLGLVTGLVMATGNVNQIQGNNEMDSSQSPASGFSFSDPDLELMTGEIFNDAAILEFDFVPSGNFLQFNFVFGSEEYPEFVASGYNDAFGFFLSGPGIDGVFSNNAINLAIVPNSSNPISVDNINSALNSQFYINNNLLGPNQIEPDGFTTVLQARSAVQCNATYHIKLVIADVQDVYYDSFVFLEGGSFEIGGGELTFDAPSFAPNDSAMYEGCLNGEIVLTLPIANSVDTPYEIILGGSAINADYMFDADTVVVPAFQTSISIPISALSDPLIEGAETLSLLAHSLNGCGSSDTLVIEIHDLPILEVVNSSLAVFCGQSISLEALATGGIGFYNTTWSNGETSSIIDVTPWSDSTFTYTVTDTCGIISPIGTVEIDIIPNNNWQLTPLVDIDTICSTAIQIQAVASGGFGAMSYVWSIANQIVGTTAVLDWTANDDSVIELAVTDQCGFNLTDSMVVTTGNNPISLDLGGDLSFPCNASFSISPILVGGTPPFTFAWSDFQDLGNSDTLLYVVTEDTELMVTAEDACGAVASDTINVSLNSTPLSIDIGPNVTIQCSEPLNFEMEIVGSTNSQTTNWFWNGALVGDEIDLTLNINEAGQLIGSVENACGQITWDTLQVDVINSVITLSIDPVIMVECMSLTTILTNLTDSTGYDFEWVINGVTVSNDSILTYPFSGPTEVTVNAYNACGAMASAMTDVILLPSSLSVDVIESISTSCLSEVTLGCIVSGGIAPISYEWFSTDSTWGTSDNLNFTTAADVDLTVQVIDACGNIAIDVAEVNVIQTPIDIEISNDLFVCANEIVELIGVASGGTGNIVASWQHLDEHPGAIEVPVTENAIYTYWAMDQCGQFATAQVEVGLIDLTAQFTAEYVDDYAVSFTNLSDTNYFAYWLFGDGTISYDIHPTHEFVDPEQMTATLFLQSGLCLASAMEDYIPPGTLYIPNCFTADDNGLNEVIFAYGSNLSTFNWKIFNRWGEKIFETNDLSVPWDGSHLDGTHYSPDGIYSYNAYAKDNRGNTIEKRGWILLIR